MANSESSGRFINQRSTGQGRTDAEPESVMRILSFSTCPLDPLLGSGKTRLRWSTGLRELGHSVEMVEPKSYETWRGMRRALGFRQAWGARTFVKERVQAGHYGLIEFIGGEFGMAAWRLAKSPSRPLIVPHT